MEILFAQARTAAVFTQVETFSTVVVTFSLEWKPKKMDKVKEKTRTFYISRCPAEIEKSDIISRFSIPTQGVACLNNSFSTGIPKHEWNNVSRSSPHIEFQDWMSLNSLKKSLKQ